MNAEPTRAELEAAWRNQWAAIDEVHGAVDGALRAAPYEVWGNDVPRDVLRLLPQGSQKLIWLRLNNVEIVRVTVERLGERDVWAELRSAARA